MTWDGHGSHVRMLSPWAPWNFHLLLINFKEFSPTLSPWFCFSLLFTHEKISSWELIISCFDIERYVLGELDYKL